MNQTLEAVTEAARALYTNLKAELLNATTRVEHIRITRLSQEAHQLLTDLETLAAEESTQA